MASGRPLFPGSTVEDQLQLIFSLLGNRLRLRCQRFWLIWFIYLFLVGVFGRYAGTPTEETWSGIHTNEDFLSYRFDHCAPQSLIHRAPRLDGDGLDLLNKFLCVSLFLILFLFFPRLKSLVDLFLIFYFGLFVSDLISFNAAGRRTNFVVNPVRSQKADLSTGCHAPPVLSIPGIDGAQTTRR